MKSMDPGDHSSEVLVADPHSPIPTQRDVSESNATRRKVFYLVDSLNVGGTEVQAVELATRLNSESYAVTLGCLRVRGPLLAKLKDSAVELVEFYPKGGFDSPGGIYQMFRLARFLRRGKFQIVHTHDLYSNLLGIPAARIARVPVIISSQRDLGHLDLYKTSRRIWLRRLQKMSAVVLTNANAVRDAILTENCFPPGMVRVIYNGVELERFRSASRNRAWLGLGENVENEKWIVLVGSMYSDVKGHPWLIDAAPSVVQEFPEVRFVLVGDGVQRAEFEKQTERLGLAKHFSFLGRRDDVPAILACCDIGVLPSRAEGLPNAVLEYLAAGLPTVASTVGGNVEIIKDDETGLLVPAEDASALAAAVLRILKEPGLAATLRRNGQSLVATNFSFQRMIDRTDQLYTELLHARGRA